MKKIFILLLSAMSAIFAHAQTCTGTINMPASGSCTVGSTAVNFFDSGGASGNYLDDENRTYTICPSTAGQKVSVTFTAFVVESCCDDLRIYNGTGAGVPLLGTFTSLPPATTSTATNGCLTFLFSSDGSVTDIGWAATVRQTAPVLAPANDNCAGAISMTVNAAGDCTATVTANTTSATNSNVTPTGVCTSNPVTPDDDIWYSFVAPASGAVKMIGTYVSGSSDVYYQVFSGACAASMPSLLCTDSDGGFLLTGLTAGTDYSIRFYSWSSGVASSYTLCLQSFTPAANDNCATAIPMTLNAQGSCASIVTANTEGATNSNVTPTGVCTSNPVTPDDDIWYSFVAPASGAVKMIGTYVSGSSDVYYQLFSGACASTMPSLVCTDNDGGFVVSGLTAGTTYYIRFYTWSSNVTSTYTLCLQTITPPTNDNCATAIQMTVNVQGTCTSTVTANTEGATNSNVTPTGVCTINSGTSDDDIWYTFVAPASGAVKMIGTYVTGSTNDVYYQVFSGACAASMPSLLCTDNNTGFLLTGLTSGTTYSIRFYTNSSSVASTYTLCLQSFSPPTNDNCATAIPMTVNAQGSCASIVTANTDAATNSNVTPTGVCTSNPVTPDDDIWYSFVAPATGAVKLIGTYVSGNNDVYYQVFSGACAASMPSLVCTDNDGGFLLTGLTSGTTYSIRFYSWSSGVASTYTLCLQAVTPPTNDNCATAIPMTVNAAGDCTATVTANTDGASNSNVTPTGACTTNTGTPDDDIWYTFVAPATGAVKLIDTYVSGSTSNVYYQVFSGACAASMSSLLCTDNDGGFLLTGLTAGTTYSIRFYTTSSGVASTYTLCLQSFTPPTNDNCATAIPMTVNVAGDCTATVTANTEGATNSNVTPTGVCTTNTGTPDDDIWYTFVAPASGAVKMIGTYVTGSSNVYYQVFSGACAATMPSLVCTDNDGGFVISGLTTGTTYRVRFYTTFSGVTSIYTLCLQSFSPLLPGGNTNACTTPIPLCAAQGQTLSFQNVTGAADAQTTNPGNFYGCLSTTPRPAWFHITVQNPGAINLTLTGYGHSATPVDNDFALYGPFANTTAAAAACNSYTAAQLIDCSYDGSAIEGINIPTSTTGQVYVLLVTGFSSISSYFTMTQETTSTGTINCTGVTLICDISNVTLANIGSCNDNATATTFTDDYYTADVTVTYSSKPATGDLQLTGTGIYSGTYTVAVGSAGLGTYTFTGVRIKANGSAQSITAQFTATPACVFTKSNIAPVYTCSCAATASEISNDPAINVCEGSTFTAAVTGAYTTDNYRLNYFTVCNNIVKGVNTTGVFNTVTMGLTSAANATNCTVYAVNDNGAAVLRTVGATYSITGTTCFVQRSKPLVINPKPIPIIATPAPITCVATSVSLNAGGSMGTGLTYQWADASGNLGTNATQTVIAVGTYSLTVQLPSSCTASTTVTVVSDYNNTGTATLATATLNATELYRKCDTGNWTYYADPADNSHILFGINWSPSGSITTENATIKAQTSIKLYVTPSAYAATTGTGAAAKGAWSMNRWWEIHNPTATALTEDVNVRFFYDPTEVAALQTANDAFCAANTGIRDLGTTWFKVDGTFSAATPQAVITPTGVTNATPLMPNTATTAIPGITYTPTANLSFVQLDGLSAFSTGTVVSLAGTTLPVKLLSFAGYAKDKDNLLEWTTATEQNNAGFEVQASPDPSQGGENAWQSIGFVRGAGNSTTVQKYGFTDNNVQGNRLYKLKQVDFDGKFEYSNTIFIKRNQSGTITAFPNPSATGVFTLSGKTFERTDAVVTNVLGQNINIIIENNILDLSGMPAGMYFVRIAGEKNTIRVVKS